MALSVCVLVALAPFARVPFAHVAPFIPAYESALALIDLITAALLFGQFLRIKSISLLVLACGYLFAALIIIPHALSFPGVFAPDGLLGGDLQSTAWLYCFWHGGFALSFVAYALTRRLEANLRITHHLSSMLIGIALTTCIVVLLAFLSLRGGTVLTRIIDGTDYSMLVWKGISPAICATTLLAIALLWNLRRSTLDLWLLVVMCAWLCDVTLSAIIGSNRFDLGWYGGRTFGLIAALILLVSLLFELNAIYDRLMRAELHRTTSLFEAIFNMTPDLVFVKDLESRAILRNPAAMFGKNWSEIEGKKEEEWHVDSEEAAQVVMNDKKVIETREAMQFVEKFTTALGVRTLLSTKSPLLDAEGNIAGIIGVSTDITEREDRAKHFQFILKELSHRSKNLLMIIQAIARQGIRQSATLEDFETRFNDRLASLSRLHDLLVQEEWKGASLQAVAQTQTNPFGDGRVNIAGPSLMLKPDVAQVISMILHELATNASKYGALSSVRGQVGLSWDYVGDERKRLFVRWEESGGPPVIAPTSNGFGTLVLERMALQIQGASSVVKFNSPGVIWYLEAPVSSFGERADRERSGA
jgi:PAS domain S-box-containing protein